jgi:tripartite-type tricarboxylate transporter receptor subunit TctC
MVVQSIGSATTVPEFIALAKADPGKSPWLGRRRHATHLAGELFQMMTGAELVHAAYRGGAGAYADLIAGRRTSTSRPCLRPSYIKTGQVRALAVTTPRRQPQLDSPTVGEFVPATRPTPGLASARETYAPPGIVDRLNTEINAASPDPKVAARLADSAVRYPRARRPTSGR